MSKRQTGASNTFFGRTHTDQYKAHIRAIAKAKLVLPRADAVDMLNVVTLEVTQFRSIREASRALKSDTRSITKRLNNGKLFRDL